MILCCIIVLRLIQVFHQFFTIQRSWMIYWVVSDICHIPGVVQLLVWGVCGQWACSNLWLHKSLTEFKSLEALLYKVKFIGSRDQDLICLGSIIQSTTVCLLTPKYSICPVFKIHSPYRSNPDITKTLVWSILTQNFSLPVDLEMRRQVTCF